MAYQLTILPDVASYQTLYIQIYCDPANPIITFDGIVVRFFPDNFDHAFYESTDRRNGNKDLFSTQRSERILWIKETLEDATADIRIGYDSKSKTYNNTRRVAIVKGGYVVVILLKNATTAKFLTAYLADNSIGKILASPLWP